MLIFQNEIKKLLFFAFIPEICLFQCTAFNEIVSLRQYLMFSIFEICLAAHWFLQRHVLSCALGWDYELTLLWRLRN